ncbi:F-actin-capping protein subunit alpha [Aureobasidium pullulans]|nr:F-actin-capping protein subunit alpha [Aureobasidium pullulans]THX89545.1 F-actin-capping protein subunit alpha [Aureobasidium pullulans]TIA14856.1 F-actin-capping protein subunit alpha [Aureobasidium pullulans]
MSSTQIASSFVEDAPPGEVSRSHVPVCDAQTTPPHPRSRTALDIKALTPSESGLISNISPAITKYHETQFSTVKLPGSSGSVLVSPYNSLGNNRYYDSAKNTAFDFDPVEQKASNAQSHSLDSQNADLIQKLHKALRTHADEHYPAATVGVFPAENDTKVALVLVSNKYSPNNFWNGRWRAHYLFSPSNSSLSGAINIDVHYYEDGNVRLQTSKPVSISNASDAVREIAKIEKSYQTEVNQAFTKLNEGAFKGLRRQLPVTRQKVEWEKISGYRLGQDIGGGRSR